MVWRGWLTLLGFFAGISLQVSVYCALPVLMLLVAVTPSFAHAALLISNVALIGLGHLLVEQLPRLSLNNGGRGQ